MTELIQVVVSGGEFLLALLQFLRAVLVQYWAIILWVVFWLFLVRWPDLRIPLRQGGWTAFVLLYFLCSLTWGLTTDPYWSYFGVTLTSILEKSLLALFWVGIAFLCGWLQDTWRVAPPEVEIAGPPDAAPAGAGHGHGHGNGHDH